MLPVGPKLRKQAQNAQCSDEIKEHNACAIEHCIARRSDTATARPAAFTVLQAACEVEYNYA